MTTYIVNDFSFNIGTTNISQQYVPLVKQDVPWGINSTYIYKAPTLANQFNVNNKHLVIENKCLSGNIVFKTKDTGRIIINDLSVGTINGLPYSGNGSGVGIGLTANSVNSSHIIDGSILGTDICNNTITSSKIANGAIVRTKLSELTTNLMIYNSVTSTTTLGYSIILNTAGTLSTYFFVMMGGIGIGMTHSVRVCIPNITTQIGVQIDTDGKNVSANQVYSGAIQVGTFTDNTLFFTLDPDGYDNIQIGFAIEESI
jgi:hypothetical protein